MSKQQTKTQSALPRFMPVPAVVLTMLLSFGAADAQDIVVVSYRDFGLTDVSSAELGRLFLALSSEVGGVAVKAVNQGEGSLKTAVLGALTGMSANDIELHFVSMDLRGDGGWPPEVATPDGLVKLLVKYKKAIGWMTAEQLSSLSERSRALIEVVAVDGRRPGDGEYILAGSRVGRMQ